MKIPISEVNIITMLGLTPLPLEERAKIIDRVTELVEMRVLTRLFDVLPGEKAEKLRELVAADAGPEIGAFLEAEVSNFNELAAQEVLRVKEQLSTLVEDVRDQERGAASGK